jgi:autotransporter-associated beta strand protein
MRAKISFPRFPVIAAFLAAAPLAHAGLAGYWNFDEGAGPTAHDYTVNDNEGTLTAIAGGSAPLWIAGHTANTADHALQFSQGNVEIPDSASLHITNTFTLAAWYYDTGSNYGHLFTAGDGGAGGRTWLLQTSAYGGDSAYFWSASGNTEFQKRLNFVPPLNSWHHLAVTYDGANMISYLDGVPTGPAIALSSALDTWGTLRLGGFSVYGSGCEGYLDDMVIFNSVENIPSIMNGTHLQMRGYWTGGGAGPSHNWSDAANWGGTLPKYIRPLVFDTGNGLTTNTNDFAANRAFKGITFLPGAGAFTLNGNAVNLTGDVVNDSAGTQTIALAGGLVLDGSRDCTFNAAAGDIAVTNGLGEASGQSNGVVKSGPGKVTVSGGVTYSGDTNVDAGILALDSPNPDNDDSAVAIASGAQLELNFTAGTTDRVFELTLDGGAPLPDGVYGSTASGVAIPDDLHFAGLGTLTVNSMPRPPTTFYVSESEGDDSWTGEAETPGAGAGPWRTLGKASSVNLVPGDQILLKAGDTWNEELQPKGNGTPANPIVIAAYGTGDKPVIDRLDDSQDRNGIHLVDQEGYKIAGIEFNRCMTGIYAEYSDEIPTKQFIWIEDCYFHDSLTYGGYQNYPFPKNISLGVCFFSHETENKIVLTDITIRNCVFRRLASGVWTNSPDNFNQSASFIYNFGNMTFEDCLFEEGYQWQMGIRGVDGGAVRNCVTHDIGRLDNFLSFNGVAGGMFFRCKNWVFEDSEWGFVSIGGGSWDGEAFDFEGNCDHMFMRNCLFHDTDGPGFLLVAYASDWNPNMDIRMENCVLNGKSRNTIGPGRAAIFNTTDWTDASWLKCRFYLSPGEPLMRIADPETDKRSKFGHCIVKNLAQACSTPNLAGSATVSASSGGAGFEANKAVDGNTATAWKPTGAAGEWLQLEFPAPIRINEFKIREDPSSSVIRYVIQRWDDAAGRWCDCFNGRGIGAEFVAPIVSRSTRLVRLMILQTTSGNPSIREFEVYHDATGELFSDLTGAAATNKYGN